MRILIYGINYAPEATSTGKYTTEMAEWFVAFGHEVTVICGLPHYPQWTVHSSYINAGFLRESLAGVSVYRVPHYVPGAGNVDARARIRLETSFSVNAARYWLPVIFSKKKYDAVVAICPPMQCGIYPWLYSVFRGVPWIFHVQDLQVDAAARLGMLGGRFAALLYRIEEFLLKRASVCSTITQAMARRLEQKGVSAARLWVLPNWADTEAIRPSNRNNAFREALGVRPNEILVMYSGAMGRKQGLEVVLDAAAILRDRRSIRFLLIGAGAERDNLEAAVRGKGLDTVQFLPVQPAERLPEMLAAADVHLVVQKVEAADLVMPSKLTNILSAGRASVATALPGTTLHDVLTQHEAGLVVPPGDAEALVDGIQQISGDEGLRRKLEANARRYAEVHLRKDAILQEFEGRLLGLVQNWPA